MARRHSWVHPIRGLTRLTGRVSVRGRHARIVVRRLHQLRVCRVIMLRRHWRRSMPPFLFLFNGHLRHKAPHPSFAVPLNLPKGRVLREVVTDTTLPTCRLDTELIERVFPLNGTIYLWK